MEYASRAVGNTGLGLGIAGSALGLLNGAGGLMNLFGGQRQPPDPDDRPVTRYEMGLWQQINAERTENAVLRGQKYTDAAIAGVQEEISQQTVWNTAQTGVLECLKGQIAQIQSMTKLYIPSGNIAVPPPATTGGDVAANSSTSGT